MRILLTDMTDDELKNLCLIEIEKILNSNARFLRDYQSIPYHELSDLYTEQKMTNEQRLIFDEIFNAVITDYGGFYFIYEHGGYGKTFIWNELSSAIWSREKIVLNVASNRIASLLIPGGRMVHSRFSIPIIITDKYTYNIKNGSLKAKLLIQSSLIIWGKVPMLNKICFEALDRTLRDLMSITNQHKIHQPFSGKVVVLGGDFKKILLVIKLYTNMRFLMSYLGQHDEIEILDNLLIITTDDPLSHLVNFAYSNLLQNMSDYRYFQSREILAPTFESVEKVNDFVLTIFSEMENEYLSSDTICEADGNEDIQQEWFILDQEDVMLLRNIDDTSSLCNETRLTFNELGNNVIGATVMTGRNIGDKVYISRMNLIPSVYFAMTINKSQGQSLSHVGLYLSKSVFTHRQLYVALSRVKNGLKVLILDKDGNPKSSIINVMFKEVFNNI
ncbi:hypothetical protein AAHE18_16G224300 [Arachis hypogaea]